LEQISVIALRN